MKAPSKKLAALASLPLPAQIITSTTVPVAPFIIGAVLLHAGGFIGASQLPIRTFDAASYTQRGSSLDVEIDLDRPPSPERPQVIRDRAPDQGPVNPDTPRDETHPEAQPDRVATIDGRPNSSSPGSTTTTTPGEPGSGNPNASNGGVLTGNGEPGGDDWSAPGGDGSQPGLPGTVGAPKIAWSDLGVSSAAPPAPTSAPKAAQVSRDKANDVIGAAVRSKDSEYGLDFPAAGTIASIFRSTVQGSEAPGDARATFQVVLGPGGKVQTVKVVSSAGGGEGLWSSIAKTAQASIASNKFNMPSGFEKGAVVVVNVQSKMKMPSGADVDAGLKLSLTQTFDVADIGARPVRVVSAQASASPVK
ncbi:MAG: hypothetical protein U0271_37975 [Polyangiaceae bacterium]